LTSLLKSSSFTSKSFRNHQNSSLKSSSSSSLLPTSRKKRSSLTSTNQTMGLNSNNPTPNYISQTPHSATSRYSLSSCPDLTPRTMKLINSMGVSNFTPGEGATGYTPRSAAAVAQVGQFEADELMARRLQEEMDREFAQMVQHETTNNGTWV
jgi:hypothetical protein